MYQISEQQIDYILNDISARGVEMESLQQNLVDHVCCIIEQNLEENGDFESFYQTTIKTFYKDALWEIEEETLLLLTFKNYYAMKKVMITSGIFSLIGPTVGSFFKIMHWPGASILMLFPLLIFSLVFLPLLFIFLTKNANGLKDKLMIGIGTTFGILFIMSSLFKIMHWPGANIMWLCAIGLLILVFIPIYFFSGIRNPETKVNTVITTIVLMVVGGTLFALTNLKSSKQVFIAKTYSYLENEELLSRMKLIKSDTTSQNSELKKLAEEIQTSCNKIKTMIIIDEIGLDSIPQNFEGRFLYIQESGLGDKFNEGEVGEKLIKNLVNKTDAYNSLVFKCHVSGIRRYLPVKNIIGKMLDMKLLQQSNYNLLFSLTQLQLLLLENEKGMIIKEGIPIHFYENYKAVR